MGGLLGKCLTNWSPKMPISPTSSTPACCENQLIREVSLDVDVRNCLFDATRSLVCSHAVPITRFLHLQWQFKYQNVQLAKKKGPFVKESKSSFWKLLANFQNLANLLNS